MTSLFSSFDLGIFLFGTPVSLGLLSLGLCPKIFASNLELSIRQKVWGALMEFFLSLNNSNFSKNFSNLVVLFLAIIFFFNVSSIFPFTPPFTSQMSMVLSASLIFWVSIITFSLSKNLKSQLGHYIPEGSPIGISFILFLIEIVSNLIRPITLSVRLVANILAGHLLVTLLSLLVAQFYPAFFLLSGLNLVEIFVSLIQSYIFATLICLYYSDL